MTDADMPPSLELVDIISHGLRLVGLGIEVLAAIVIVRRLGVVNLPVPAAADGGGALRHLHEASQLGEAHQRRFHRDGFDDVSCEDDLKTQQQGSADPDLVLARLTGLVRSNLVRFATIFRQRNSPNQ